MSDDEDPEVIADLRLRAATQFDRTRSSSPPDYVPPKFVGKWKCRTPGCSTLVDITEETMERWSIFNSRLRSVGESPLDTTTIVPCADCDARTREAMANRRRLEVDRMAVVIRGVKLGRFPLVVEWNGKEHKLAESEAYDKLAKWGHPDVPGLKQAIAERNAKGSSTRTRKAGM